MPLSGGASGKVGVRYEDRYTALEVLKVLRGEDQSLTIEPTGPDGDGVEFVVEDQHRRSFHQVKRQRAKGPWTLKALKSEGVLATFLQKLEEPNAVCFFASQESAGDLLRLTEDARSASSGAHFKSEFLKGGQWRAAVQVLEEAWNEPDPELLHDLLRRIHVRTQTEPELIYTLSESAQLDIDLVGKISEDFVAILVDRLRDSIHHRLTREKIIALIAKSGYRLNPWQTTGILRGQLDAVNERMTQSLQRKLIGGQLIERPELAAAVESVKFNRVTVLAGDAGSGKSAFLLQLIDALRDGEMQYLLLRLSDFMKSSAMRAPDLGSALGLAGSPQTVLARAGKGPCVLILDQVDALSIASGRSPQVLEAVHEMARCALTEPNLRLVMVCRAFDIANDPQIRELMNIDQSHKSTITLGRLSAKQVIETMDRLGLTSANLTAKQQTVLASPLALALLAESSAADEAFDFSSIHDLHEKYWDVKRRAANEQLGRDVHWVEVVEVLADHMSDQQSLNAPMALVDTWRTDVEALISCGVLFLEAKQLSFFHETFFDYVFARCHVRRRRTIQDLLVRDQWLFRRAQVRQILAYEETASPRQFLADIQYLLSGSVVRLHLRHLTLALLPRVHPSAALWLLIEPLLTDQKSASLDPAWSLLASTEWFRWADSSGFIERRLADSDWSLGRLGSTLVQNSKNEPDRVAELLGRMNIDTARPWIRSATYQAGADSRALFDLYKKSLFLSQVAPTDDDMVDGVARSLATKQPAMAIELLGAGLDAWAEIAKLRGIKNLFELKHGIVPTLHIEFLPEAARLAPAAFFERIWPVMLRLMRHAQATNDDGLVCDEIWRSRHLSANWDTDQTLLAAAEAASAALAQQAPADFRTLLTRHADESLETAVYVLYQGLAAAAVEFGDEAAAFVLADLRRLKVSYRTDRYWGTCRLFRAVSRHVSIELFAKLESVLVGYRERSSTMRWWYDKAEFALLSSLDHSRLSAAATRRLGEMQRKFQRLEADPPEGVVGGFVQSPIPPDRAAKMSDEDWAQAMREHRMRESWQWKDGRPHGGARELASVLEDATKNDPPRFVRLALRLDSEILPVYFEAILRGVGNAPVEPSLDVAQQLIRRCHSLPGRPCGRWFAYALRRFDARQISDDIIDILSWYALNDKDPAASAPIASEFDLLNRGLNSARGAVADGFARLVLHRPELLRTHGAVIDALCEDPADEVRAMAAEILIAESDHDQAGAFLHLLRLIEGRSTHLLATRNVLELLRFYASTDYATLAPTFSRLMEAAKPEHRELGASLTARASIDDQDALTVVEALGKASDPALRKGVARVYAANLTLARFRDRCEDGLRALFNDSDPNVREYAADSIRRLTGTEMKTFAPLVRAFMESNAFVENAKDLAAALSASSLCPVSFLLEYCERILGLVKPGEWSHHYQAGESLKFLVRACDSNGAAADTERAMNLLDHGLQIGVYRMNDLDRSLAGDLD